MAYAYAPLTAHLELLDGPTTAPAGDRTAKTLDDLFRTFAPRLRSLANRRLPGWGMADDIVQETFLRAHRAYDRLDPTRPAWPWLKSIANNVCTDVLRDRQAWCDRGGLDSDVDLRTRASDERDAPDEQFIASERRRTIAEALASVNPRQRRIVMLRDVEGWDNEQVAELEGSSIEAVKAGLKRGRQAFRLAYAEAARGRGLLGVLPLGAGVLRRTRAIVARAVGGSGSTASGVVAPATALLSAALVVGIAAGGVAIDMTRASGGDIRRLEVETAGVHTPSGLAPVADAASTRAQPAPTAAAQATPTPSAAKEWSAGDVVVSGRIDDSTPKHRLEVGVTAGVAGEEPVVIAAGYDLYCDNTTVRAAGCAAFDALPSSR